MADSNSRSMVESLPSGNMSTLFVSTGVKPHIPPEGFTAAIFTVLALSILTILARIVLRLQRSKSLQVDDYLLIVALILLAAAAVVQQHYRDLSYLILNVELGNLPPSAEFVRDSPTEASMLDATSVLLWTSIFCVKFSFMFFFRKLVRRVRIMKIYWWVVFAFLLPCALVCITLGFVVCPYFGPDFLEHCPANSLVTEEHIYLNVTVVLDIFTDVLIISLPIALLWNVKIDLAKKLTLLGMFGLSFVMIVIALIRVTMASVAPGITDTIWLFFWQVMEASIALVMVSVSAFRGLFGQAANAQSGYASGRHRGPVRKIMKVSGNASSDDTNNAPGRLAHNIISSPRSPKVLASFTLGRAERDVGMQKNENIIGDHERDPSIDEIEIEMASIGMASTALTGRSQNIEARSKKRSDILDERSKQLPPSPPGVYDFNRNTPSPVGVSAMVWSDNDQRTRASRLSRWDAARKTWNEQIHGSSGIHRSRSTSHSQVLQEQKVEIIPQDRGSAGDSLNTGLARPPSADGEVTKAERREPVGSSLNSDHKFDTETADHSHIRNASSSSTTATQDPAKVSIGEWV